MLGTWTSPIVGFAGPNHIASRIMLHSLVAAAHLKTAQRCLCYKISNDSRSMSISEVRVRWTGHLLAISRQPGSLFVRQRPGKMNVALDSIEHSFFGFAFGAIGGVDSSSAGDGRSLPRAARLCGGRTSPRSSKCTLPKRRAADRRGTVPYPCRRRTPVRRQEAVRGPREFPARIRRRCRAQPHFFRHFFPWAGSAIKFSSVAFCFTPSACWLRCRNASSSALIWSLRVEHMPCGAPGIIFRVAPLTSFEERRADAPMGTIWSSSP